MCGLQSQSQVDRDCSGTAATLRVHHREDSAAGSFVRYFALRRSEPDESFQKIGGRGRPFDEFARAASHCMDDHLRLRHAPDREYGGIRQFLTQEFHAVHGNGGIVGGNIDQDYVGSRILDPAHHRICSRHGKRGRAVHGPGHAGSVHQDLQHGPLFPICGNNYY